MYDHGRASRAVPWTTYVSAYDINALGMTRGQLAGNSRMTGRYPSHPLNGQEGKQSTRTVAAKRLLPHQPFICRWKVGRMSMHIKRNRDPGDCFGKRQTLYRHRILASGASVRSQFEMQDS